MRNWHSSCSTFSNSFSIPTYISVSMNRKQLEHSQSKLAMITQSSSPSVVSILWAVTCQLTLSHWRTHIYFYICAVRAWPLSLLRRSLWCSRLDIVDSLAHTVRNWKPQDMEIRTGWHATPQEKQQKHVRPSRTQMSWRREAPVCFHRTVCVWWPLPSLRSLWSWWVEPLILNIIKTKYRQPILCAVIIISHLHFFCT